MTLRTSVGRRGAAGLALLVLTAGGTAACSAQSGAAAVLDDGTISVGEVQSATQELGPYLEGATPASVLAVLVAEPTFAGVAAENGVAVSTQEARRLLTDLASGQPGASTEFSDASVTVARFTLLQQALQELPDADAVQQDVQERLEGLDVDVNPRYGQLDFAGGGVTPVEHPWLVPPAS